MISSSLLILSIIWNNSYINNKFIELVKSSFIFLLINAWVKIIPNLISSKVLDFKYFDASDKIFSSFSLNINWYFDFDLSDRKSIFVISYKSFHLIFLVLKPKELFPKILLL